MNEQLKDILKALSRMEIEIQTMKEITKALQPIKGFKHPKKTVLGTKEKSYKLLNKMREAKTFFGEMCIDCGHVWMTNDNFRWQTQINCPSCGTGRGDIISLNLSGEEWDNEV